MEASGTAPAEGGASMPEDLSLAISVQQNLKLCAAAVGQVRNRTIWPRTEEMQRGSTLRRAELRGMNLTFYERTTSDVLPI